LTIDAGVVRTGGLRQGEPQICAIRDATFRSHRVRWQEDGEIQMEASGSMRTLKRHECRGAGNGVRS